MKPSLTQQQLAKMSQRYSQFPLAFRFDPKLLMFDSLARRVPNWIAFFLNCEALSSPNSRAILRSSIFSPPPAVSTLSGTFLRYSHRGRYRKGYLASFPFIPIARSSRPRFRIHSRSMSKTISFSISSNPARLKAILQREYPANISSAPSPVTTILALVPALARCRAAAMLKSMWVVFGQMLCTRAPFICSRSQKLLFSRIRLYLRPGLKAHSYWQEMRPASRSGASSRKARLTRSICSSLGRVRSSRRAMRVESMPPEKRTARLGPISLYWGWASPLMHLVNSRTLSTSSFLTVILIISSVETIFSRPIFFRSREQICCWLQKASPFRRRIDIIELPGISNICLPRLDDHSASYLAFQFCSVSSSARAGSPPRTTSSLTLKCSKGALVSMRWCSLIPSRRLRLPKQSLRMKIWSPSTRMRAKSPRTWAMTSLILSSDPLHPIRIPCSHLASFSPFSSSIGGRLPVSQISPLQRKQEPGASQRQLWLPRRWRVDWTPRALPLSTSWCSALGSATSQLVLYMSM